MLPAFGSFTGMHPVRREPGDDRDAGKRDEVLQSDAMWMCTSCYNCVVRCPRKLPITHIMHGLANYAHRLGIAPKGQPTRDFAIPRERLLVTVFAEDDDAAALEAGELHRVAVLVRQREVRGQSSHLERHVLLPP